MTGCQVTGCCLALRASHRRATPQGRLCTALKEVMLPLRHWHTLGLRPGSGCEPLIYRVDVLCPCWFNGHIMLHLVSS